MLLLSSLIYDVDMQLKGCKFLSKKYLGFSMERRSYTTEIMLFAFN